MFLALNEKVNIDFTLNADATLFCFVREIPQQMLHIPLKCLVPQIIYDPNLSCDNITPHLDIFLSVTLLIISAMNLECANMV
jgi:hypothetical protein